MDLPYPLKSSDSGYRKPNVPWLDIWLFGYLAIVVALYVNGSRLADILQRRFGAMPVREGIWSWVWSIDRVGTREAWLLLGITVAGGLMGFMAQRLTPFKFSPKQYLLLALCIGFGCGAWFWYGRVMHSLGDSLAYLEIVSAGVWFKMSQPLTTALFTAAYTLLARFGWPVASSVAVVNCMAGAAWVFALFMLAREMPGWPGRLLLACSLFAGGATLFWGYIETTSTLITLTVFYVYFARRALNGSTILPAALVLGLALPMHGQALYLLPSFVVLCLALRRRGYLQIGLSSLVVIIPTVVIITCAAVNPHLHNNDMFGDALGGGDGQMFVALFRTNSPVEFYTLFSFNYFTELFNLVLRATPLLGVLLFPAGLGLWIKHFDWSAWFMATAGAGALAFVLFWNPDLGMAHDWDLFTPSLMLLVIVCVSLWPSQWVPRYEHIWIGATLGFSSVALFIVAGYFSPIYSWDIWATDLRPTHPLSERFGNVIDLLGYGELQPVYHAGDELTVQLFWRGRQPLDLEYTAGVYLMQQVGQTTTVIAQDDHRPEASVRRYTPEWEVGEIISDRHTFIIPPTTSPGQYQLWVVLYDLNTLKRLPLSQNQTGDFLNLANILVK